MNEERTTVGDEKPAIAKPRKRASAHFELGHPRFGGKRKNATTHVRELCNEMGVDPIAFMLEIIRDGVAEQTVIENGKKRKTTVTASLDMRADLAKHVSRFLAPQLASTAVTGPDDGPIQTATINMTALLDTPEKIAAAQMLAISMCQQDAQPALETAASDALETTGAPVAATDRDYSEDLKRDHTGQWMPK